MQMNETYLCISFFSQYFDKTGVGFCIKDRNNYVVHYIIFLFKESTLQKRHFNGLRNVSYRLLEFH